MTTEREGTMSYAQERLAEIKGEDTKPGPLKVVPVQRYRYCLRITGPKMDTTITIDEPSDMEIVDAVISKLRRAVAP